MSEKQHRDKVAAIKKAQGKEEAALSKARAAAAKYRAEAARHADKITSRTSPTTAKAHQRAAKSAEDKAVAEDKKTAAASTKLGKLASDLSTAETNLDREVQATARRAGDARKSAVRKQDQDDAKRRQVEKRHAQEVARLARPTVIHEVREVPAPAPEMLRVLYLTANPLIDDPEKILRVDVEVRQVEQAVKAALHRDHIQVIHRPAATPEDLLDGLNDIRPHVVHFSGHAGGATLLFDNASVEAPEGRTVTFEVLTRALAATATPPVLLVLNGCDTLDGAEVLLNATPVVVAMATDVTDLAAVAFATRFYAAIASAQPVRAALDQAAVGLDLLGLDEGWKPRCVVRDGVSLEDLVLVKIAPYAAA